MIGGEVWLLRVFKQDCRLIKYSFISQRTVSSIHVGIATALGRKANARMHPHTAQHGEESCIQSDDPTSQEQEGEGEAHVGWGSLD